MSNLRSFLQNKNPEAEIMQSLEVSKLQKHLRLGTFSSLVTSRSYKCLSKVKLLCALLAFQYQFLCTEDFWLCIGKIQSP